MYSKIKTPQELSAERYAQHAAKVNKILSIIRLEFTGVPCSIRLISRDDYSSYTLPYPEPEVWNLVQTKLEEELRASGWAPFDTYLTTSGFLFWKTPVVMISTMYRNEWLSKK